MDVAFQAPGGSAEGILPTRLSPGSDTPIRNMCEKTGVRTSVRKLRGRLVYLR